jgi:hypothetical protein
MPWISRWYEGRLSSVSKPISKAVLGDAGQPRLVGRPRFLVEVATEPVRDVLVGEPLLGHLGMAVVQPCSLRLQLVEQGRVQRQGVRFGQLRAGVEAAVDPVMVPA